MRKKINRLLAIVVVTAGIHSAAAVEVSNVSSIRLQMKFSLAERDFQALRSLSQKKEPPDEFTDEFAPKGKVKSPQKAFLLSLLLPGAGQFYNESKTKAKIFVGSEASLWLGFLALRSVGSWKKSDYKNYAVEHAGINPDGKDDKFYERMTFYDDRDQYNQFTRLFNGPAAPVYPETDYWNWEWDSSNIRAEYRDLRNQSKNAYRRSLYLLGLAGLNRILSAVEAFRGAKKFNRLKAFEQEQIGLHPGVNLFGSNRKISLTATKSFF